VARQKHASLYAAALAQIPVSTFALKSPVSWMHTKYPHHRLFSTSPINLPTSNTRQFAVGLTRLRLQLVIHVQRTFQRRLTVANNRRSEAWFTFLGHYATIPVIFPSGQLVISGNNDGCRYRREGTTGSHFYHFSASLIWLTTCMRSAPGRGSRTRQRDG
jgi:hypothetical protein